MPVTQISFFPPILRGTGPPQRFDGIYGRHGDRVGDEAQAECQGDWVADCSRALVLAMSGGVFPLAMLPDVLGSKTGDLIIAPLRLAHSQGSAF